MNKSESVVLCEGYYDRAFWAGWLEYLGCTNPAHRRTSAAPIRVEDPWGNRVIGGAFALHSKGEQFVRITPCGGKSNVIPAAKLRLGDVDKRLLRLVLCVDSDADTDGVGHQSPGLSRQAVQSLLGKFGQPKENEHGEFSLDIHDDGPTVVSVVEWEASDARSSGIPDRQTLERLVCAALVAAYPDRGPAVQQWLDSRPNDAPQAGAKEFAWSHMAGWFAERGCDAFYRKLWKDDRVARELKSRLAGCGAWRIAEALAE